MNDPVLSLYGDSVASEQNSRSDRCPKCGSQLFCAVPGKTTVEEIIQFAESAPAFRDTPIAKEGWIHPGRYCPNGCHSELWEFRIPSMELWEHLAHERRARETSSILVAFSTNDGFIREDFSIYIDGNIRATAREDSRPVEGELIRIEPGDHRIVVRDRGHLKPGRRESNTIHFSTADGQEIRFRVCARGAGILLRRLAEE